MVACFFSRSDFRKIEANMIRILGFWLVFSCFVLGQTGQAPLVTDPPKGISIPNIIQSFAANETDLKEARERYTYTREVTVRASCKTAPSGVYHLVVDVGFDKKGNRSEKVKTAESTLQCIYATKEDLDSFRDQFLFVLTTKDIQDYQINFVGQQQQDSSLFYVFDVSSVATRPDKKYFEGRIWVDAGDLLIVRSHGTITANAEKKRKAQEFLFPEVTTWRVQTDGRYWFPSYSRASEVLHFPTGDVQFDEVAQITNYKPVGQQK